MTVAGQEAGCVHCAQAVVKFPFSKAAVLNQPVGLDPFEVE